MGDQYIKKAGVWTKATRPYIKVNGAWLPAKESWVKRSGVWTLSWFYDNTPPSIPEMSLEIIDNRYIKIGLRLPDSANDPRLKNIRLLALPDVSPTTQFGSGYIRGNANGWPGEDWSNWWYNGTLAGSNHGDSHNFTYKSYPLNPTATTNLPGGKYYYFAAWSMDIDGNWSVGQYLKIWMPKNGTPAAAILKKEANITADAAGTISGNNGVGGYAAGMVKAHNSPRNNGVFFYGTEFNVAIGVGGTPTVTHARIRLSRSNDNGQAQANVNLAWFNQISPGGFDPSTANDQTLVGTIQKGETKWFDLPTSWYTNFNTQIKAIVVRAGTGATDDVELNDLGTDARNGEVDISWTEAL